MSEVNVVFLDRDTLSPEVTLRDLRHPHNLVVYDRTEEDQIAERIADADVIITNKVPIGEAQLKDAGKVKMIAIAATGYDRIDLEVCKGRGITVSNIRNYAGNTVPEHTFCLILALRRSLVPYRQSVLDGRWEEARQFCYFDYPIRDLSGSTLGIVGSGALGSSVAKIAEAFGMEVLLAERKGRADTRPGYTAFDDVIRRSDIITFHCPLTPATRHMISYDEFAAMERGPLIINTGRGGLVDEEALEQALDKGQISGAGFDVATTEPPGESHIMRKLAGRDNVILTPHVAWASREAVQGLADQLIGNIDAFLNGTPRNTLV